VAETVMNTYSTEVSQNEGMTYQ